MLRNNREAHESGDSGLFIAQFKPVNCKRWTISAAFIKCYISVPDATVDAKIFRSKKFERTEEISIPYKKKENTSCILYRMKNHPSGLNAMMHFEFIDILCAQMLRTHSGTKAKLCCMKLQERIKMT